jgi:hypothetical protein
MKLKCITLHAEAIFSLGKDVENRSWQVSYRGPLAIHAGLACDDDAARRLGLDPKQLVRGAIIGVVDLIGIVGNSMSKWAASGQLHWLLATPEGCVSRFPFTNGSAFYDVVLRGRY